MSHLFFKGSCLPGLAQEHWRVALALHFARRSQPFGVTICESSIGSHSLAGCHSPMGAKAIWRVWCNPRTPPTTYIFLHARSRAASGGRRGGGREVLWIEDMVACKQTTSLVLGWELGLWAIRGGAMFSRPLAQRPHKNCKNDLDDQT